MNQAGNKQKLYNISGTSYFFTGRVSVGAISINHEQNKGLILIDSTIDESSAKTIHKIIKDEDFTVSAIINTHAHPDHIGGNDYFKKINPELKIYSSDFESCFIQNPSLAALSFNSGAYPTQTELNCKYLTPQNKSEITHLISFDQNSRIQKIQIHDAELTIFLLPGHSQGMIGILSPDGILYLGDSLFGEDVIKKHSIPYYTNIKETLKSFDFLSSLRPYKGYVLYHGGYYESIQNLIKDHRSKINEIIDFILSLITNQSDDHKGVTIEVLLKNLISQYNIADEIVAYTLTQTSLKAYLSYLQEEKLIHQVIKEGVLLYSPLSTHKQKNSLAKSSSKIQEVLENHHLNLNVQEFSATTRTSIDAAKAIGCKVGQIAKSLIFKTRKENCPILIIASGDNRVDEKKINEIIRDDIEKSDANFVLKHSGFAIGGVPPIGHPSPIRTYIDEDLLQYETVWTAAGTPHSVFEITPKDLIRITAAQVADLKL